jgi:hypothetical protein
MDTSRFGSAPFDANLHDNGWRTLKPHSAKHQRQEKKGDMRKQLSRPRPTQLEGLDLSPGLLQSS